MNVAGIDFSTRAIDVVWLEEDTNHACWRRYDLVGGTAFDRARSLNARFPYKSAWDDTYLVGLEETFSVTFNAAVGLARVQGAIIASLPYSLMVLPTPPNEWQRVFLGLAPGEKLPGRQKGARQRAYKARAVELGFGDAPDLPIDAYAAYGIAYAARELNRRGIEAAA